ncbi:MAG: hypothetical protein L0H63_00305 [Nitrococcus sp.]|nr:hypothetical protein [Nitrococcus sp.]
MLEIACVEMRDGVATGESVHRYINPGVDVSDDVLRDLGTSSDKLADKAPFAEAAPYVCDFLRGRAIIAYDLDQVGVLEREMTQLIARLLPPWKSGNWDLDAQCSLQSLSMLGKVIEAPGDGLRELCAHYGVEPPKSPSAFDEANCVGAVYAAMEPDLLAWEREYGEAIITDSERDSPAESAGELRLW